MQVKDSQVAFDEAIKTGRLSADPAKSTYAGKYMYMYTDEAGKDQFKSINSRTYLI